MSKKMLINATHPEENRVAIVEDGILTELDIEIAGKEQTKGNIYKAAVVRVESGLQAAFVDYGGDRLGFLQMGELHPSLFRNKENNKGRNRINDVLQRGQELLVQIVKEERGTKGAALTTYLSLPGRYMVLMPDSDTKGVSRKISDEGQRRKLKDTMASLDLPNSFGYIVRTAAIGQSKEELKRDFTYLQRLYESIESLKKRVNPPALVYKESNLIIRSIRDYFSTEMDEVLVDDPKVYQEARDFFQQVMPEYAKLVKLHQERRPIFARYQIEEQIETISKSKVPLPSGGSIVIDSTEALVAVDVNSGKLAGEQGVEATAYRTNLEAAAEVGRQLRLRDLGGLIVIDFIDMRERKHDREVEKKLKHALKNDKARVTVGRISQFGLLEMSRQRIKATLAEGAYLSCPHCNGSGKVKSVEAQAVAFLRKLQAGIAKGQIGIVEGEIPLDVATYLLNTRREELHEMERQRNIEIFIKGRPDFLAGQSELNFQRRPAEKEKQEEEVVEAGALPEPQGAETAPQPEPVSTAEASESTPSGEEGNAKRKRRRRRRKKPAAAKAGAEAAETPTEAAAEGPTETPALAAAAQEVQKEAVPAEIKPASEGEKKAEETAPKPEETKKPSRPRGRRRKKPEAETAVSEVVEQKPPSEETAEKAAEPQQVAQGEAAPSEEAPPQAAEAGKKPSRARGRRRKTSESEAKVPSHTAAQEKTASQEKPAEPAVSALEEKKPARSRRRGPKKSEAEAAPSTETAGEAQPAPEEKPAAAGVASETLKSEKPRSRAKRKQAGAAAAALAKAGPEEKLPAAEGDAAVAEEKPKRRTRKKTADTAPEGSEKEAGSAPAAEAEKTEPAEKAEKPKPARRTRTKKPAAKKEPAAGEKASLASAEGDEPKGPQPRKTAAKVKGESSETAPTSGEKAPKPAAKKAAPKKAAARSKTADQETSGKAEEKDQAKKATAKPRAPRKKAATAKKPEAVEEKTES